MSYSLILFEHLNKKDHGWTNLIAFEFNAKSRSLLGFSWSDNRFVVDIFFTVWGYEKQINP